MPNGQSPDADASPVPGWEVNPKVRPCIRIAVLHGRKRRKRPCLMARNC